MCLLQEITHKIYNVIHQEMSKTFIIFAIINLRNYIMTTFADNFKIDSKTP